MTTYNYSDTGDFGVSQFVPEIRSNVIVSVSGANGAIQTVELPGARWFITLTYPDSTIARRIKQEAFWAKVRGQVNRINMFHLFHKVPIGTMRGTPTVSSNTSQGASVIPVHASAGATLLAGDIVGINGQWCKLTDDVTFDGSGNANININVPIRAAITAGTSVIWDKPTIKCITQSAGVPIPYGVDKAPSFSVSLVEMF